VKDRIQNRLKEVLQKNRPYSRLYRNFISLILVTSLVPHLLIGWGGYLYFSNFSKIRLKDSFQSQVQGHRKIIELFLKERTSDLGFIAQAYSLENLLKPEALRGLHSALNREGRYFIDLGVIDDRGRHLAYAGPYPLKDKNYSEAFWFKEVMKKGIYISDMFMGFRNSPHFIIAYLCAEGKKRWILRASLDTDYFRSLVENVKIGRTGQAYLLNQSGIFQTNPRFRGKIMEKSPWPIGAFRLDSGIEIFKSFSPPQIVAYAWLDNPRWLLVVQQEYSEAFKVVNRTNWWALIFLHLGALGIILITITVTFFIIGMIRRRDQKDRLLNEQLLQASKLASMGELSAKVAHELNSPLGGILIYANLLMEDIPPGDPKQNDLKEIAEQTNRCKEIVKELLEFSRQSSQQRLPCSLNQTIRQTIDLLGKQALFHNIQVVQNIDPDLPLVEADPNKLTQVLVNLVINAVDAMQGNGTLTLRTHQKSGAKQVILEVSDTGVGIPPENLPKIFEPFFTTKEVGKGTGLGLSTVYGIVQEHGGNIEVRSKVGQGTTFILYFPLEAPLTEEVSPGMGKGSSREKSG
jgi:two-component system, NtrC family, sensor kinase